MIRVTRWSPDTCDCCLEYSWDDAELESTRTHKFQTMVVKCPAHLNLSGETHYNEVLSENRRKNKVFALAQNAKPDIKPEDYEWAFDNKRVLQVKFPKLTNAEKKKVKDNCDTEFGVGKVEVV